MIVPTHSSTRTATLFPYTTLFRSFVACYVISFAWSRRVPRLSVPGSDASVTGDHQSVHVGISHSWTSSQTLPCRRESGRTNICVRSEEHTSELQSLMRSTNATF